MTLALDRPAARAASRAFGAGVGLAVLGATGSLIVLTRLIESWHVGAHAAGHHITLLGQRIGYPAANAGAIVVLALAVPALIALLQLVLAASGEVLTAFRLEHDLHRLDRPDRAAEIPSDVLVLDEPRPLAFCAGLVRPRIYVSTGAIALLDAPALTAVLAHERHHAARRDPLRLAAGRVLARSLFFVPGIDTLAHHQAALSELEADEAAMALSPGSRAALARAVLRFTDAPGGASIEAERIDALLGEPPGWSFPVLLIAGACAVTALIAAVAVLAGRVASGTASLAPPFLSRQPCVLTLAALTGTAALLAAGGMRRLRSPNP